jgi:DedD protein
MEEIVKYRIIGGTALAILALSLLAIVMHIPTQYDGDEFVTLLESLPPENKLVVYKAPVASKPVQVDSVAEEHESRAAEAVEAQAIVTDVKFHQAPARVVEAAPVVTPKPPVVKTATPVSKASALSQKSHLLRKPQPHPSKPKQKPPTWTVQVASFKQRKNALILKNELRRKGYAAYIRSSQGKPSKQRVFVGAKSSRARALKLARKIQHDMKISGLVVGTPALT